MFELLFRLYLYLILMLQVSKIPVYLIHMRVDLSKFVGLKKNNFACL